MSCTENESGPFVVFFLPAVVGCLTILLARRWANSQAASTSSTAVSRRRKIIKDPLVKRPLPPIACKMVAPAPAAKKSTSLTKKGTVSQDEDGGRRAGRVARLSPTSAAAGSGAAAGAPVLTPEAKLPEGPMPPKHIPFPYIPQDGELLSETMTFVFSLVATGLQFLNLYRTAWWLPNSYTNQAMNFYLIDPHLVAFIVAILSRRFLLSFTVAVLKLLLAPKVMPHATVAARMFILGVVMGALAWCSYFIWLKHPLLKIFYLCYPAVIYFLLFGLECGPFVELNGAESPLHCCSHEPRHIRAEVDAMRQDFNLRVKKILFNSVLDAYYSSFIPCCFAQPYVYYEVYAASQQTAFVWGACAARCAAALLPAPRLDAPHRAARHLGAWSALVDGGAPGETPEWSADALYAGGARVSCAGKLYTAAAPVVAAEPRDNKHARFYAVFINPSTLLCLLLCMQLSMVGVQLCLLFSSLHWHYFIALVILLFINYYTLFKMLRDYLVAWKVYKAENMIQDKNSIPTPVN